MYFKTLEMSQGFRDVKRQQKSRIESEIQNMQSIAAVEFKMVALRVAPTENKLNNTLKRVL